MQAFRLPNVRTLSVIAARAASAWISDNAPSMGAALAFYTLFAATPLLIIGLALAGYLFGPQRAQTQMLSQLPALIGGKGAEAVRGLILSAHYNEQRGVAAIIGIVTFIIGATSVFAELEAALERIWKTPHAPHAAAWWRLLRGRVFSLGMVLGTGFLLLVSLVASAALGALGNWLAGYLPPIKYLIELVNFTLSVGITVLLFASIFKYVPREGVAWGDVWVGAVVTAFLFFVGKLLIGLYLGKSTLGSAYGAAGSLILLLLWIYYSVQIFLYGAEFTCVFAHVRGSRLEPNAGPRVPASPSRRETPITPCGTATAGKTSRAPQQTSALKFLTIGYGSREGYDRTKASVRDAADAHDAQLRESGALMGIAGTPVQVRNPDDANVETKFGPFMSSSLPVAGFAVIQAATLAEAVKIVSKTPCAVAHGVIEVWPLE